MQDGDPGFLFDPSLAVVDPNIRAAIAYWEAKRGARFAPSRSDLSAREAKHFLPHLQIFEILEDGLAYRPRLIGTSAVAQIGEDSTGQLFDSSSTRAVVHRVLRAHCWVLKHRKPLRTFAKRTAMEGRDFLAHETIFLPLSSDGETIDMMAIVGAFTPPSG